MTLKRELENPGSPLRRYLDARLPDIAAIRASWLRAIEGVECHSPPSVGSSGTPAPYDVLGHAIGLRLSWTMHPGIPAPVAKGARILPLLCGTERGLLDELLHCL